ncbi:MAG: hypothetical protein AB7I18_06280 [Candidatus Berkiella sp.]
MSLFGIVEAVTNTAVAYGASTSLGKSYAVRPKLEEELAPYIKEVTLKLIDMKATFTNLDPQKKAPELKTALLAMIEASNEAIADLKGDALLDTLTDIVGNHIADFASVEEFKKALPKMKSIAAVKDFAATLVDHKNYSKIEALLKDINGFGKLSKAKKMSLLQDLDSKIIAKDIVAENTKLDITKIKAKVKKMAQDICKELKLKTDESEKLISLFDELTSKHLPKLNPLRLAVVEKLPAYLDAEYQRLSKEHPELVVQQAKPTKILTQFKQATSTKPKETGKRKATDDAEKPIGKAAPKKTK